VCVCVCVCVCVSACANGYSPRVAHNGLLRETFESRMEGVTGNWRRLHNEELYDLCFLPNIIRVIKSGLR
jgi:hypothetical protein